VNDTPTSPTPRRHARGDGRIYRRPGSMFWWMRLSHQGREIRESTGTSGKKKAQAILKAKRDELAAARGGFTTLVGPETKSTTVKMLLDALLLDFELRKPGAVSTIRYYAKHVDRAFGSWKAVDVTKAAIKAHVADRLTRGHAPSSINHGLQTLAQALRPFLTERRLPMPEIRKLGESNAREGFYSRADAETLIAALPDDLRDFVRWGWLTGWRKAEIASLKWSDVDRETGSIRLSWRATKTKHARTMALVGELGAIIERRAQARAITTKSGATLLSPLVFHRGPGTGKHAGSAAPVMDFDKAFVTACKAAGIPYGRKAGRTFHCFRRTAARNLRNAGVPENVCMAVTGHKTRSMFDRYGIVNEHDTAEAMTAVQATLAAQPAESNVVSLRR
jgi:integrase